VAKLKAAKEEADAKRAQIQKDMKDEMERLRTQFTFRVISFISDPPIILNYLGESATRNRNIVPQTTVVCSE